MRLRPFIVTADEVEQSQTNLGTLLVREVRARHRLGEACDVGQCQLNVEQPLMKDLAG